MCINSVRARTYASWRAKFAAQIVPYAAQNVILAHFSRSVLGMKEKNIATNSSSVAVFVFNALMVLGNSDIGRINAHHGAEKSVKEGTLR